MWGSLAKIAFIKYTLYPFPLVEEYLMQFGQIKECNRVSVLLTFAKQKVINIFYSTYQFMFDKIIAMDFRVQIYKTRD